jgi:hypothetical protein
MNLLGLIRLGLGASGTGEGQGKRRGNGEDGQESVQRLQLTQRLDPVRDGILGGVPD